MEEAPTVTAYMIAFDDQHQELVFPVDSKDLRAGDLLLLKTGGVIPADCKILSGEVWINETAYRTPRTLKKGSRVESGTAKAYVTVPETDIY